MTYGAKAYAQVGLETNINSASPHGLIVLLYDGAMDAIKKAKIHIEMNDIESKLIQIDKALKIIKDGLTAALDVKAGGELAEQLLGLYDYISKELLLANIQNSTDKLDTCYALLSDLRDAWQSIGRT